MERGSYLGRNGHAAARQRKDYRVLILVCCERLSQFATGFEAIFEGQGCLFPLVSRN